jgi:hypothetical protein
MAEVLKGNRELFKGLWIDSSGYDFTPYPVIQLNMTGECGTEDSLRATIITEVRRAARANGLEDVSGTFPGDILKNLVDALYWKTGKKGVAILIDEYDAPIQSKISNIPQAVKNRVVLHDFYSALKTLADQGMLRLLFVTGVTKFAQASIFSVFNNLKDLSMDPAYNGVCGFTMEEFDAYFSEYLPGILEYRKSKGLIEPTATLEDLRGRIMDYYDGYSWNGERRILNPFSLIKFLNGKEFEAFWFASGTPTFLLEYIKRVPDQYVKAESHVLDKTSLAAVDVTKLRLVPLLFQTGYLTVERALGDGKYALTGPNREVDEALNTNLLAFLTDQQSESISDLAAKTRAALESFDSVALGECFSRILAWVPHELQPALENYNHALIFSVLKALHFKVESEVSGTEGRFDLQITMPNDNVFIAEFKYGKFDRKPDERTEEYRREFLN